MSFYSFAHRWLLAYSICFFFFASKHHHVQERRRQRKKEKERERETFNEITFPTKQDRSKPGSVDPIRRDKRAIVIRVFRTWKTLRNNRDARLDCATQYPPWLCRPSYLVDIIEFATVKSPWFSFVLSPRHSHTNRFFHSSEYESLFI